MSFTTPGDVATDGCSVALADMAQGELVEIPAAQHSRHPPRVVRRLEDIRSVVATDSGHVVARTFPGVVERIDAKGTRTILLRDAALPGWIENTDDGLAVLELGTRHLTFLDTQGNIRTRWLLPGKAHVSHVAANAGGTTWVAERPMPLVRLVDRDGQTIRAWRLGASGELTGICCVAGRPGAALVLCRTNRHIYRVDDDGVHRVAKLPPRFRRARSLRCVAGEDVAYTVVDPAAGLVGWLDRTMQVRTVWEGRRAEAHHWQARDGDTSWSLDELGGVSRLVGPGGEFRSIDAEARDIRCAADGRVLVVLRDLHCVVVFDAALRPGTRIGCWPFLAYPCSADFHPSRRSVVVLDPLRARLVEFDPSGRLLGVVPIEAVYPRWIRCTPAGATWVLDMGKRRLLAYDERWREATCLPLPAGLDPLGIESVEAEPEGITIQSRSGAPTHVPYS